VVVLALALVLCLVLLCYLNRWRRRERAELGLTNEAMIAADDSARPTPTLYSAFYRLVGRPDQLVRAGRMLIPVEHKPRARRLHDSHILQVAAQCLLVQEVYGVRPTYGLVVLAGGIQERVEFTATLEQRLLDTMSEMRALVRDDCEPGPLWVARKCRACGFRETCWDGAEAKAGG
jgi:CRISPR-associated exonuclease Cas4